jgi:hypothetical protein
MRDQHRHCSEEGIAPNILCSRLKRLVGGGLLTWEEADTWATGGVLTDQIAGIQTLPAI